jgi:tetratricopeptide (TPR) repeat protein
MAKGVRAIKRVTKKELKEDKFVTGYFQARKYLDEHQGIILKIAGGAVLVIALAAFWIMSKSGAQTEAAYELSMAMLAAQTGDAPALADKFTEINKRFSGTESGDAALFYLGKLRIQEHNPTEAIRLLGQFLRHASKSDFLYPAALAGKAAALEDLGKPAEAAQFYLKAAEAQSDFFAKGVFRLDAARCWISAGEKDKAREQYQFIEEHYPQTTSSQKALDGLAKL